MLIELENFSAKITLTRDDRLRLVLEYPCEDAYRARVMLALSDILRPSADKAGLSVGQPVSNNKVRK